MTICVIPVAEVSVAPMYQHWGKFELMNKDVDSLKNSILASLWCSKFQLMLQKLSWLV